jgi:hypothetical protein
MNHTRLCSNQVHWSQKHNPSEGIGQFFTESSSFFGLRMRCDAHLSACARVSVTHACPS